MLVLALTAHGTEVASALALASAVLAGAAFALNVRPRPRQLLGFGRDKVQVRSLDEWCLYQYNVDFEIATAEQQREALDHYRVGLRLFPARPQDRTAKQGYKQRLLSILTLCSFSTTLETFHGWSVWLLVLGFYGWMWLCIRWSKRFYETPTTSGLVGLEL